MKFCLTLEPFQAGGFSYETVSAKVRQSSELARLAGISVDTLRYYERNRLLPAAPRSSSGYRLFPPEALIRVQMIRGALSVGFSVKELEQIFTVREHGGTPCHQVRKLGTKKLLLVPCDDPGTRNGFHTG